MKLLDLAQIIGEVTNRATSFFEPDIEAHRDILREKIDGKTALVIGGAGTIGSSYVKALLRHGALQRLYVVDINENGLTELTRDIRSSTDVQVPEDYKTYPVNFGDPVFKKIFLNAAPFDIVANFAAHKHVRSEKDEYSIEAMVDNNVLKAKGLMDLLLQYPPQHFFCVSTDKAANPVNIMGASKKLMEELIMAYSSRIPVTTARFANVAYSNGSLPDGFIQRLFKKQPLSAPADVKRFFVSPAESGEICMMACLLGQSGDIFFPKLDAARDMQTFTFIAERLLAQMGYTPDYCGSEEEARQKALQLNEASDTYPVYFFNSDTSGEKPYEEFYTGEEELDTGTFASLGVIKNAPRKPLTDMQQVLNELQNLFDSGNLTKAAIVAALQQYLPGFGHIETGKSLDQKM